MRLSAPLHVEGFFFTFTFQITNESKITSTTEWEKENFFLLFFSFFDEKADLMREKGKASRSLEKSRAGAALRAPVRVMFSRYSRSNLICTSLYTFPATSASPQAATSAATSAADPWQRRYHTRDRRRRRRYYTTWTAAAAGGVEVVQGVGKSVGKGRNVSRNVSRDAIDINRLSGCEAFRHFRERGTEVSFGRNLNVQREQQKQQKQREETWMCSAAAVDVGEEDESTSSLSSTSTSSSSSSSEFPATKSTSTAAVRAGGGVHRERILLVDASSLVYRAYYAYHYLSLSSRGRYEQPPWSAPAPDSDSDFDSIGLEGEYDEDKEVVDTSSIFGFTRMLLTLLETLPSYVSVCFDSKGKGLRHDIFPAYKENRKGKTPEFIKETLFPQAKQVVKALQLHSIEVPGYEADDLIATLTRSVLDSESSSSLDVDIASPDKDFYQILGPRVRMLKPLKKKSRNLSSYASPSSSSPYGTGGDIVYEAFTEFGFREEFGGLEPHMFTDLLALAGDSSDNIPGKSFVFFCLYLWNFSSDILSFRFTLLTFGVLSFFLLPGVRGIGPKTGVKLIKEFGDLESIFRNASEIKGKVARNALMSTEGVEAAKLSKRLVQLNHVPDLAKGNFELESDLLFGRPSDGGDELLELFRYYDFQSLIPRIETLWNELDKRK